jgi:hypothetical protein
MSVHVSACTDQNSTHNASSVKTVALIRRVFLRLVAKMGRRFLEQRIDVKFSVKLRKTADGGETYCFHYDSGCKRRSLQWKQPTSPRP